MESRTWRKIVTVLVEVEIAQIKEDPSFPMSILLRAIRSTLSDAHSLPPKLVGVLGFYLMDLEVPEDYVFVKVTTESTDVYSIKQAVEKAVRPFVGGATINLAVITVPKLRHMELKPD